MNPNVILLILDGWGIGVENRFNPIYLANTKNFDSLKKNFSHSELRAHGKYVGLSEKQVGNSEVGHLTIGSGRVVKQKLPKINDKFQDGSFEESISDFISKFDRCHVFGVLSNGGVHSHVDHIRKTVKICEKNNKQAIVHGFSDGRDVAPFTAKEYIDGLPIGTICGRYYAMDRDKNYDRTRLAFDLIKKSIGKYFKSPLDAINYHYKNNISDEFFPASKIGDYDGINKNDCIIITNYRSDRVKQIGSLFLEDGFNNNIIGFSDYGLPIKSFLEEEIINNTISEVIASNNLRQLKIAETEKYAHVTYFINGGIEAPFTLENRILIQSPKVSTYDMKPEMSANEITDALIKNYKSNDFIVANYANPDMVGHTGDLEATIKAIECVDNCVGRVLNECSDSIIIVTADHGNAELLEENGKSHTYHTTNPVPFIINKDCMLKKNGGLADISPTILSFLGIPKPHEMQGDSLIKEFF